MEKKKRRKMKEGKGLRERVFGVNEDGARRGGRSIEEEEE